MNNENTQEVKKENIVVKSHLVVNRLTENNLKFLIKKLDVLAPRIAYGFAILLGVVVFCVLVQLIPVSFILSFKITLIVLFIAWTIISTYLYEAKFSCESSLKGTKRKTMKTRCLGNPIHDYYLQVVEKPLLYELLCKYFNLDVEYATRADMDVIAWKDNKVKGSRERYIEAGPVYR